jgi:hypothetical protein
VAVTRQAALLAVAAVLTCPGRLPAQTRAPAPRVFVAVDGTYQAAANDFRDGKTFRANAEEGRFDADYAVESGPAFDVSGGATLWRRLAVGVGVSRFSRATPASFSGSVPHPFFFNRLRAVTADVGGLRREELAVHVQARGVFNLGARLQVTAFGGPTFFRVRQTVVSDFTYTDAYPYDTAAFQAATTVSATASARAFNAGGDVAFFFTRRVGVGAAVRLASADVDLPSAGGGSKRVAVGGVQGSAGLRLRF